MMKAVWSGAIAAVMVLGVAATAAAQASHTGSVTVQATVAAKAKLTLGAASVSFADADPDTTPLMTATAALNISVKARTSAAGSVTLSVSAADDLKNAAGDVITVDNLTWTTTGDGYAAGTAVKTTDVSVGTWTGPADNSGTQTYKLVNSWSYKTGTYSVTMNYTLSAA